jgi:hypothetical protein
MMIYAKLAFIGAIVLGILWGAHWLYQRGQDTAILNIERANNASESKADAAERCVLAGKWNQEAGKCEP